MTINTCAFEFHILSCLSPYAQGQWPRLPHRSVMVRSAGAPHHQDSNGSIPPACPGSAALLPTARSTGSEPPMVKPLTPRDRSWRPFLFPALRSCSLGPISQIMQLPSKPRSQVLLQGVNLAETDTNLFYFVHVPFSPRASVSSSLK